MSVSFIKPRSKSLVAVELKWFFSIGVTILAIVLIASYLLGQAVTHKHQDLSALQKKEQELSKKTVSMLDEHTRLQALSKMHESIGTSNRIKKENIKNFFDLVPDGVILKYVQLQENTLHLKGTTKSKRYFNKNFQRALNSLFTKSKTRFSRKRHGLYHFSNISILEVKGE